MSDPTPAADQPGTRDEDAQCIRAFREHFDFVHRSLRRSGARPADLDDLVQDVFIAMWLRWQHFDRRRPLRPWLAGIAFRLARKHARRRWREVAEGPADLVDPLQQGEETLAAAQTRGLVLAALGRLPDKYRIPLVMHDLDELTVPEVADTLALPLATAYTRVRRARLAFATIVREMQESRAGVPAPLNAEALLAAERTPPPVPARARKRAESRLRAVMLLPPPRLDPQARPRRVLGPALAVAIGLGTVTVVAIRAAAPTTPPATPAVQALPAVLVSPLARGRSLPRILAGRPPAPARPAPPVALTLEVGLVGHWPLDDAPGGGLVRDASGQGRHCRLRQTAAGAAWTRGVVGGALDLAGRSWLECPAPETPSGGMVEITVAAWVRRSSDSKPAALVTRQIGTGFHDQFFFGFGGDGLRVVSHAWSGWAVEPAPPPLERWFHAAFTHDAGGTTRLYVDGALAAQSRGQPLDTQEVSGPITIGAGRFSRNTRLVRQHFGGALDEVRLYDRVLSPGEIAALATLR